MKKEALITIAESIITDFRVRFRENKTLTVEQYIESWLAGVANKSERSKIIDWIKSQKDKNETIHLHGFIFAVALDPNASDEEHDDILFDLEEYFCDHTSDLPDEATGARPVTEILREYLETLPENTEPAINCGDTLADKGMTRDELIALNPMFEDRPAKDVDALLDALREASYNWTPSQSAFVNENMDQVIQVDALHRFDARSIREWWGNEDYMTEQYQLKFYSKISWLGILSVPVAILISFFWDWRIGLGLAVVGILAFRISDSRHKKVLTAREKREGRWVDRSKIEWCKNCVHFRKIRNWEDSHDGLWTLSEAPQLDLLPCGIAAQTSIVWQDYFAQGREQRTLYPKNCPNLKMKV